MSKTKCWKKVPAKTGTQTKTSKEKVWKVEKCKFFKINCANKWRKKFKKIFFFIKRIQYVFFFLLYSLYSVNEKKCDLFLTISACINQQFLYIHIFLIKKRRKNNHPFIQLPKTTTISIIKKKQQEHHHQSNTTSL